MNITPLDITQKSFRKTFRGLDAEEVAAFLALVASEFEGLVRDLNSLREENRRAADELVEHRGRERSLQETLVAAQRASEDIRDSARKEAEITVADAELQAEKIVQGAHQRFLRIVDDINELKRQRVQFEAGLKSLAEGHLRLLEAFREPAAKDEAVPFAAGRKKLAADES
jgi:cell division initiation protein